MNSTVPIMDFMPVGFGFRPTDEELVDHYLRHKLLGNDSHVHNIIAEVDVCKFEPWHLPAMSVVKSNGPEWFFFSPCDYKYAKSNRFNRTTKCGFWKATGNDRDIKIRGTNKIIGTKKTLVYYEGRVPGDVKTNWVIHEYHAVTFDESQRTFVLCRLMKKAEGGRTDTLTCDQGEPSRYMASNCENQEKVEGIPDLGGILPERNIETTFQAPHQADLAQQSLVGIEQEGSCPNSPFLRNENNIMQTPFETMQTPFETIVENGELVDSFTFLRDENNSMQIPFEITKEEYELVKSFLADVDVEFNSAVNSPSHSESLKRVSYESIDTSTEHPSSGEFHASKMPKSSHGDVHGNTSFLSSNSDANKDMKESIFQDHLLGIETSSCDSTADKPLEINCVEISSPPSTLGRWKNQYHPKPANLASPRAAARGSQTQKASSSNAVSHADC